MRLSNIALAITAMYGGFSPASLFAGGANGVWYDPSDTSTLFQDPAGTTPVTAVEQPVGLMLDKSKGLVLGSELVTNGDFSNGTTGWTGVNATIAVVNGAVQITADGVGQARASQTVSGLTAGRWYEVRAKIWQGTGALNVDILVSGITQSAAVSTTTPTDAVVRFVAAGATQTIRVGSNGIAVAGTTYFADNISVRELPGNHAISYNPSNARPQLSARVNLLTYSEQFDNAAWTKPIVSVSVNQNAVGPNGVPNSAATLTAVAGTGNHWLYQSFAASATAYTCSVYAKAGTANWLGLGFGAGATLDGVFFNLSSGTIGTSAFGSTGTIQDVGNGWYRCVVTRTLLSGTAFGALEIHTANSQALNWNAVGTETIFIWGADLRPANIGSAVPSYQRIAAATNYDTNGFPKYLYFAGTDDGMSTPANLNLTSTDKVTVFLGVRKLSDAADGVLIETSASAASNGGAFNFGAPSTLGTTVSYGALINGAGGADRSGVGANTYAAPITNVVQVSFDYAGATILDEIKPRINGVLNQDVQFGVALAARNFASYPLYIGSRNNSSVWFNGYLYGLTVVGAQLTTPQIESMETWTGGKTGISVFNQGPSISLDFTDQSYQVWEI